MNISIAWFSRLMPALATLIIGLVFLNVTERWGVANGATASALAAGCFCGLAILLAYIDDAFKDDLSRYYWSDAIDDSILNMAAITALSVWLIPIALGAGIFVYIITGIVLVVGLLSFMRTIEVQEVTPVFLVQLLSIVAILVGFFVYGWNFVWAENSFFVLLLAEIVLSWVFYRRQR